MQKLTKIALVTGGFDPLHSGHIEYFKEARQLADMLIVGLNSDEWLAKKKGQPFMPLSERQAIIENLKMVDMCITYDDGDGSSINAIRIVRDLYPHSTIVFANGGDRTSVNIPEIYSNIPNVIYKFGVGGISKKNSSSWILREWKNPKTLRNWGYYCILHNIHGFKVKELLIEPGKSLSMQRHFKRNEFWIVTAGKCNIDSISDEGAIVSTITLDKFGMKFITKNEWHKLSNPYDNPCRIIEIQYGEECIEEDIERK